MHSREKLISRGKVFATIIGILVAAVSVQAAGKEHVLHAFNGRDGVHPNAGVTLDSAGNIFGTTVGGGYAQCGCGTVFKLSVGANGKWIRTVLHSFSGKDGINPFSSLILDAAGNLYGTTWVGGAPTGCGGSGCGVVFKLSPGANGKWTETVLLYFSGKDGAEPYASLIFDGVGNLYGTTEWGGRNQCGCGTVFKLSPGANGKWKETVLHSFNGKDGANPRAGVVFDTAGDLYGTTFSTIDGDSTVFRLAPSGNSKWTHTLLHRFNDKIGAYLYAGVVLDEQGNLFGAASGGGAYNDGTVFKLSSSANDKWTATVLKDFSGNDGANPEGGVVFGPAGKLYGTTFNGGTSKFCDCGTVFELSPGANGKWTQRVLHSFDNHDGAGPLLGNLVFDQSGHLYGTTYSGGNLSACTNFGGGCGLVFEVAP